jgi:multiple sugar transport system substrate-binding protein
VYTGSWSADAATEAWADDLLFLPTADLGHGPKIGAGSWQWGVSTACGVPDGAWEFVKFMMEPEQIAAMSENTGLIPTTPGAAALTQKYQEGGPYRVFYDMAEKFAVVRPPTPGYLIISSAFEQATLAIRDGNDVQNALDDAVDAIDRDIEDHNGYGYK